MSNMLPRWLLEGCVNEFNNTLQSAANKLGNHVDLSAVEYDRIPGMLNQAKPILYGTPNGDLWTRLQEQTVEMQQIMCIVASVVIDYSEQFWALADELWAWGSAHYPVRDCTYVLIWYASVVGGYGHQVRCCAYNLNCESWPELEQSRDNIEHVWGLVEEGKAKLEQHEEDWGELPDMMMMLPIPHDDIIYDCIHVINAIQDLLSHL